MIRYWLFITAILLPLAAQAQSMDVLCRRIADGGAYRPGVDAHGRPVAPADMRNGGDTMPDVYTIPLTIYMAQQIDAPVGTAMEGDIGVLQVTRDGRVSYNGTDLTDHSRAACAGDARQRHGAPPPVLRDDASSTPPPSKIMDFSRRERGPILRPDDTSDPEDTPRPSPER